MADRLAELALLYRDGAIDAAALDELQDLLRSDAAARDQFVDLLYCGRLIHRLHADSRAKAEPVFTPTRRLGRSVWSISGSVLSAAAAVALMLTAWFVLSPEPESPTPAPAPPPTPRSVGMLTDARDAVFAESAIAPRLGGALRPGPIRLVAGSAQVMLNSTAVVDLIGPCTFEMTGENSGRLTAGTLHTFVPESARGFTVDLPGGVKVVDLGTRFTASVVVGAGSAVTVQEGRVRVHDDGRSQTLEAGQSVWVGGTSGWLVDAGVSDQVVQGVRVGLEVRAVEAPKHPLLWATGPGALGPIVYRETEIRTLAEPLVATLLAPTGERAYTVKDIAGLQAAIDAGTTLRSYMVAYRASTDAEGVQECSGRVTFDGPILGVITTEKHMRHSAAVLNLPETNTLWDAGVTPFDVSDTIGFTDRQHTLTFTCRAQPGGTDYLRVLVGEASDPDKP